VTKYDCNFAVKSGGHALFAGASNAIGGVTIDMRKFKEIKVSEDRKTVRLGTGNNWGEVYAELEPMGLMVLGGRVGILGVGGFLLGGMVICFSWKMHLLSFTNQTKAEFLFYQEDTVGHQTKS
jgi:FAD/FMN-containing dehydrogenase